MSDAREHWYTRYAYRACARTQISYNPHLLLDLSEQNDDLTAENDLLQRQIEAFLALLLSKDQQLADLHVLTVKKPEYVSSVMRIERKLHMKNAIRALNRWKIQCLKAKIGDFLGKKTAARLEKAIKLNINRRKNEAFLNLKRPLCLSKFTNRLKNRILSHIFGKIRVYFTSIQENRLNRINRLISALSSYKFRSIFTYFTQIRSYFPINFRRKFLFLAQKRQKLILEKWKNAGIKLKIKEINSKKVEFRAASQRIGLNFIAEICKKSKISQNRLFLRWKYCVKQAKIRHKEGIMVLNRVLKGKLRRFLWKTPVFRSNLLPYLTKNLLNSHFSSYFSSLRLGVSSIFSISQQISISQLTTSQSSSNIQLKQLQAEITTLQAHNLQIQSDFDDLSSKFEQIMTKNKDLETQIAVFAGEKAKFETLEKELKQEICEKNAEIERISEEKGDLLEQISAQNEHFSSFKTRINALETALSVSETRFSHKTKEFQSEIRKLSKEKSHKSDEIQKELSQSKSTNSQLAAQVLKLNKELADLKVGSS